MQLPDYCLKIPAVLMPGGTSRGLIFKREELPECSADSHRLWDLIFLCALGSVAARTAANLMASVPAIPIPVRSLWLTSPLR